MEGDEARAHRLAIVGGGAAGTLVAVHAMRAAATPLDVAIFDRRGEFGRGVAYATSDPSHLLNVPAVRMGAIAGRPDDFHAWLRDRGEPVAEHEFVPRRAFGDYLCALLDEAAASPRGSFGRCQAEVVSIGPHGDRRAGGFELRTRDGAVHGADAVVLALGPPPAADPVEIPDAVRPHYIADPWAAGALEPVEAGESVLILGTGLTMVDVALSLCGRGARSVRALSRQGLLPRRHRIGLTAVERFPLPVGACSLDALAAAFLLELARVSSRGGDWRDVVDSLRPAVPDLWRGLEVDQKRRFLAEAQRLWEVHRFRMAPSIADRLEALCAAGRLKWGSGRIEALEAREGRVRVTLGGPDEDAEAFEVDRIVNCTGFGHDLRDRPPDPVGSLLAAGLARVEPLGIGLDIDRHGALIDRSGRPSDRLFAIGALRKGVEWEATGITEIREQAAGMVARSPLLSGSTEEDPGSLDPRPLLPRGGLGCGAADDGFKGHQSDFS